MDNQLIFILIVLLFLSLGFYQYIKNSRIEKQLGSLLGIVGNLKYRVFTHEAQLLERNGVYVPNESAEFVFNTIWGMLNEQQKERLKEEYYQNSPKHIPLWKYVLHNYKVETNLVSLQPISRIDSVNDIVASDMINMQKSLAELESRFKNLESLSSSVNEEIKNIDKIKYIVN
ncbi:hypothetical protein EWI07_07365 [Sporolactobacillus sp. THM7-4]|nr:hypothetical protein EWI07_07365 [Sporolactobacillus sp. THM7-4]